ncbi:hypothetical protein PTTG_03552 [Puccinia triticina 1-1 BBBD Race 1]|uniref:Uncharacterized protein n=1 Tax=Puccinia triticina (isolate 1-1 / race 1 (BBBD)) TaxID=630390 RepID=A0A0C4ERY2_PUCT1|nr:hypothetical protein PTTG_03552 [Puccinia triticina 1-1 BBBD Race 1]
MPKQCRFPNLIALFCSERSFYSERAHASDLPKQGSSDSRSFLLPGRRAATAAHLNGYPGDPGLSRSTSPRPKGGGAFEQSVSHTNEASQITTKQNFSSTQTTSALKNSSSAIASGSASAAANAAAGGSSNNQDHTGPEFNPNDICSPHELIGWVDDVLEKLEAKFSRIESDVIERSRTRLLIASHYVDHESTKTVDVLGTRIDSLEMSMSGLLDGASNTNPTTTQLPVDTSHEKSNDN